MANTPVRQISDILSYEEQYQKLLEAQRICERIGYKSIERCLAFLKPRRGFDEAKS